VAFESHVERPEGERPELVFAFVGDSLVVREEDGELNLPDQHALPFADRIFFGVADGRDCVAIDLGGTDSPGGFDALDLFALHGKVDDELWGLAGRAVQLVNWDRNHRFCGRCGEPTDRAADERSRTCTSCRLPAYPRLAPAVITLVERGDELLLARNVQFPEGMYSALAGFVEPGESLEEAVQREILEEVGIEVDDVRYFGSQPWPFPNSLMIGFTARHAGGELRIDERELADAQFFRKDTLPLIPPPLSIARQLIDAALAKI
jgi:NAD+ diphosphatase